MRIGVLGVQGAFTEHVESFQRALAAEGVPEGTVEVVRRPETLEQVDGLALPGGESTTISKLLVKFQLHDRLVARARDEDLPVLGTCAGLILLATGGDRQVANTETRLLGLMDMEVNRNAFGRQRESFEAEVDVKGLDAPFPAVFIRAPAITRTGGACEGLAVRDGRLVAAREGNRLALAFHPELTGDDRLHRYFVRMVRDWRERHSPH